MMRATLILFPGEGGDALRWMLMRGGETLDAGVGSAVADAVAALDTPPDVVAIVPAADVPLYRITLPALAPAQAQAAALLIAAENAAQPREAIHAALGEPDADGTRMAGVVARATMASWLARCVAIGHDPRAVVPTSALLPEPDSGFACATIAGEAVARSRDCAFVEEPALMLVAGDAAVADVTIAPLDIALASAAVDLRQGAFALRKRRTVDWARVRRVMLLLGIAALLWFTTLLVELIKLHVAADALDRRAETVAGDVLPRGTRVTEPGAQVRDAVAGMAGAGGGFSGMAAAIARGVESAPGVTLSAMTYGADGSVQLTVEAPSADAIATLANAFTRAGLKGVAEAPTRVGTTYRVQIRVTRP